MAIAPGVVAFSDWMRGYGNLVILDHGNGWMSLYAHLEAARVGQGDLVDQGSVIASAGRSGGPVHEGLYFQLRQDGEPRDPGAWCAPANR